MSLRQTLSLPIVLRDVVEPCLVGLLRPGELDAMRLEWRTIRRPDWPDDHDRRGKYGIQMTTAVPAFIDEMRLVLTLTAGDETFCFDIATEDYFPSADGGDLSDVPEELFSNLQEYITESRFGWGQLRE